LVAVVNVVILIAIIFLFICYDAILRIRIVVHRSRAQDILQDYAWRTVRRIVSVVRAYGAFRLEFEDRSGQPLPDRFLLISNHQSLMDIPVIMFLFAPRRLRFVAKKELGGGIPLVSFLLRAQGQALVRRSGDAAQAMNALLRFARRCRRDGTCPVIFPEGHRSNDGQVGTFHTAGVRRVLEYDSLPVVVATIEGGWKVSSIGLVLKNLRGTRYRVRVLATLPPPQGKKEILETVQKARERIAAEIATMRSEGGPRPGFPAAHK